MQFKRQQERSEEGADLWSAPAQRSGDGAFGYRDNPTTFLGGTLCQNGLQVGLGILC